AWPQSHGERRRRRKPQRGGATGAQDAGAVHAVHRRTRPPPDGVPAACPRFHDRSRAGHVTRTELHRWPALSADSRCGARVVQLRADGAVMTSFPRKRESRVVGHQDTGSPLTRGRQTCSVVEYDDYSIGHTLKRWLLPKTVA